jgi:hypothetical protein
MSAIRLPCCCCCYCCCYACPQSPSFADLELLYPSLHSGLQQLLDFEGDVEATFCRCVASRGEWGGVQLSQLA